ncbi:hypothetical protein Q0F99_10490 [Rathayibacter oskolensis]|uniref:hypothetical protein n=1 Tax=Rathayibacter oskolensis TaxID=1891671 RepID=UPI00265E265F|nr:hypothetical protein [Rathayibacter oskolensis]WKK70325.1 hypothetical protein Q0F99_10490 [Rathayibacter oskolensis]
MMALTASARPLSVVGVVGAAVSGIAGAIGAGLALIATLGCAATYRGFLVQRTDPPIDCLAEPQWPFLWWSLLVALGASSSFMCLVLGARQSWSESGAGRMTRGLLAGLVTAVVTVVCAVITFPL